MTYNMIRYSAYKDENGKFHFRVTPEFDPETPVRHFSAQTESEAEFMFEDWLTENDFERA